MMFAKNDFKENIYVREQNETEMQILKNQERIKIEIEQVFIISP